MQDPKLWTFLVLLIWASFGIEGKAHRKDLKSFTTGSRREGVLAPVQPPAPPAPKETSPTTAPKATAAPPTAAPTTPKTEKATAPPAPAPAVGSDGKASEVSRKKTMSEINRYRLLHDATPLGYCPACEEKAQKWVEQIAKTGEIKVDHESSYGQTVFSTKDKDALSKGADYLGTLIAATWYNQIKNYDFVKSEFKGTASDFTQLVWEKSEVLGFGSATAPDKTFYFLAYYSPAGNKETMSFYENVNKVTGAGDVDPQQLKCPEDWVQNESNCYKFFKDPMTWNDASDHCNVLKGSLTSIESPFENFYIKAKLAENNAKEAWFGLSDWASKGTYQFVDGSPFVYSDWSYDAYIWLFTHQDESRGKCISLNGTNGWVYRSCDLKLPFLCKIRPDGTTFTNELTNPITSRYNNMKDSVDKAVKAAYPKDNWFLGHTFFQFLPRDNKEVAASILLRFAQDARAPVDPVSRLRDALRPNDELKVLQVRLVPGMGRVSSPIAWQGVCPTGCTSDCYPECNSDCCTSSGAQAQAQQQYQLPVAAAPVAAAVSYAAAQPQTYQPQAPVSANTCAAQYPGCSQQCAPQCSQSCCSPSGKKRSKTEKSHNHKKHRLHKNE